MISESVSDLEKSGGSAPSICIDVLGLFHSLHLSIQGKFYMAVFIQEPMFIRYSRIGQILKQGTTK